jgi:hypothetical protein
LLENSAEASKIRKIFQGETPQPLSKGAPLGGREREIRNEEKDERRRKEMKGQRKEREGNGRKKHKTLSWI